LVLLLTGLVVSGLVAVLAVVQWELANQIATMASVVAAGAAVRIAVWAALPGGAETVRVSNTGKATVRRSGKATSGLTGPASGLKSLSRWSAQGCGGLRWQRGH
jgi:hypothetical protein